MITERIREYLGYLGPGNQRYLEKPRRKTKEGEVPIIRWDNERLLCVLPAELRPFRVLELRTAVGYSVSVMAEELPSPAHITTAKGYVSCIAHAKENLTRYGTGCITLIEGDALQVLREQPDESYDFLSLDTAKGQYVKWLPKSLQVLSPGGTLLFDNALQGGGMVEPRFITSQRDRTIHNRTRAYLEQLSRTEGIRTSTLPIGDGLTFSAKV